MDDSKSLYRKWLFHQTSIYKWLFGVPGTYTVKHPWWIQFKKGSMQILVGGWTNPIWKICASQIGSFPQVGMKNLKKIETTTQLFLGACSFRQKIHPFCWSSVPRPQPMVETAPRGWCVGLKGCFVGTLFRCEKIMEDTLPEADIAPENKAFPKVE